jgi:hypothetical protein
MVDDRVATPDDLKQWLRIGKKSIKFVRHTSADPLTGAPLLPSSQIAI